MPGRGTASQAVVADAPQRAAVPAQVGAYRLQRQRDHRLGPAVTGKQPGDLVFELLAQRILARLRGVAHGAAHQSLAFIFGRLRDDVEPAFGAIGQAQTMLEFAAFRGPGCHCDALFDRETLCGRNAQEQRGQVRRQGPASKPRMRRASSEHCRAPVSGSRIQLPRLARCWASSSCRSLLRRWLVILFAGTWARLRAVVNEKTMPASSMLVAGPPRTMSHGMVLSSGPKTWFSSWPTSTSQECPPNSKPSTRSRLCAGAAAGFARDALSNSNCRSPNGVGVTNLVSTRVPIAPYPARHRSGATGTSSRHRYRPRRSASLRC